MYRHVMYLFVFVAVLVGFSYQVRARSLPMHVTTPPILSNPSLLLGLGNDVKKAKRDSERINPLTKQPWTKWVLTSKGRYDFKLHGDEFSVGYITSGINSGKISVILVILEASKMTSELKITYSYLTSIYELLLGKNGQKKIFKNGYRSSCGPVKSSRLICSVTLGRRLIYQVAVAFGVKTSRLVLYLKWYP